MTIIKLKTADATARRIQKNITSTAAISKNASFDKPSSAFAKGNVASLPITKAAQFAGAGANAVFTQPMFFSPLHTPQNWQIASKRREMYQWSRFYYENEPKVAAAIDFYAHFPLNGFKLECKDRKVLEYYETVVENLELSDWLNYISHEYFLIGDVFPFLEILCPVCNGSGADPETGEPCNHADGSFKSIRVMNPDYIEVQDNVLADEPFIALMPDEELQMIVQRKQPQHIYNKLPQFLIDLVAAGRPIPLSNRSISHMKHNASGYATYGTSLIRRLFTVLAYKTKIMTANWIVAERLILPIRVVKVGEEKRPATEDDIQDVVNQLAAVANDPNLTIVTHHAFDYEWYGACYDVSTEILTPYGWKYFSEIDKNELVATYNQKTGEMQYQQPEEYHEYDYDSDLFGGMYHFKARSVDINVTPNHRMLVERNGKLQEAYSQDVKHDDKLLSQMSWRGRVPKNLPYADSPLGHLSLDEYLEFVGYYITEGGSKEERNKNLSEDKLIQACSISQSKESESYSQIRESVALVYPKFSTYHDKRNSGCDLMTINSVDIARYLAKEFGAHSWNKKTPRWIKDLPQDKLRIFYDAMMVGDGGVRNKGSMFHARYKYTTTSKQLSDDWSDICLKLGYWPSTSLEDNRDKYPNRKVLYRTYWSEHRAHTKFNIREQHILREEYDDKVYCVKVPNSWVIVRRNGKIAICGNTGKIHNITSELEEIGKEILDGVMLNQALLNGEMGGYQSAQVGVETMIRRLENWRNKLSSWVEKRIFLPIAMMQGHIDKEKTERTGKTEYLHPTMKWDDMHLRDKTNRIQLLIQMHDKGMVSKQVILEEAGLDYDTEVERIREETVIATQSGQLMGGQPGGDPMAGGAMGGDMGGGAPGGDPMGGGAPPMPGGDMGGAPGGDMGGGMPGGMPMGGAPAAAASIPKITKKGKSSAVEEEVETEIPQPLKLTSLEAKMYKSLIGLNAPYKLFAQYNVQLPGQPQPFVLDFAYPELGVGVETDGRIWHERADLKERDMQRDQKLANVGWRILRFDEDAVEQHMSTISDVIHQNMVEAQKERKAASSKEQVLKLAELKQALLNPELSKDLWVKTEDMKDGLGYVILIGNYK